MNKPVFIELTNILYNSKTKKCDLYKKIKFNVYYIVNYWEEKDNGCSICANNSGWHVKESYDEIENKINEALKENE